MPKKKIVEEDDFEEVSAPVAWLESKLSEITTSYGNGELNELKEKINEIIRFINR